MLTLTAVLEVLVCHGGMVAVPTVTSVATSFGKVVPAAASCLGVGSGAYARTL